MIRLRRRADLQLRYASSPIRAIFPTPRKGEHAHGHHKSVTHVCRRFCHLSPRPVIAVSGARKFLGNLGHVFPLETSDFELIVAGLPTSIFAGNCRGAERGTARNLIRSQ